MVKSGNKNYLDLLEEDTDIDFNNYTWVTDNVSILDDPKWQQDFEREVCWKRIQEQAEKNPALKEAVAQMMTIYNLCKDYEDNNNGI